MGDISPTHANTLGFKPFFNVPTKAEIAKRKVNCEKIAVQASKYGDGAFAKCDMKKGECIEWGVVRRLPMDGNESTYVFTWSEDRKTWATTSGSAMFYNTHPTNPNTTMLRFFETDRFEIYANRDIKAGEELTHTYRSLMWRQCFNGLADAIEESDKKQGA